MGSYTKYSFLLCQAWHGLKALLAGTTMYSHYFLMKHHDCKAQIYQWRENDELLQSVAPGDVPSFHKLQGFLLQCYSLGQETGAPCNLRVTISGLQLFPYLKLTFQKGQKFERKWEPRFSTSYPNILVKSRGHLTLRLMTALSGRGHKEKMSY